MSKTKEKAECIRVGKGTVYQKSPGGTFYYRYQIHKKRKAISLQTANREEALEAAGKFIPVIETDSLDVIAAHVKFAKSLVREEQNLLLRDAWNEYEVHPDRARPSTMHEQKSYRSTWQEFCDFMNAPDMPIREITPKDADRYSEYLKTTRLSVSTHNRKIKRITRIFKTLCSFCDANPFASKTLHRKEREEQEQHVRRRCFTKEQEAEILKVLEDPSRKLMNKDEIRVVYYLGMFTGQRLKDCVLLQWDKVDLNRRRIWVKQFKTGKEVTIPIADKLLTVLQEAKKKFPEGYVTPNVARRYSRTDPDGKNVGNNLVDIDVLRVIRWIGLEPSIEVEGRKKKVTVYGFHSLRHSFASHCAEAGVPKAVVISILGASSEIVDQFYTHVGDEAQVKAIEAVGGSFQSSLDSLQSRVSKALTLIDSSKETPEEVLKKVRSLLCD